MKIGTKIIASTVVLILVISFVSALLEREVVREQGVEMVEEEMRMMIEQANNVRQTMSKLVESDAFDMKKLVSDYHREGDLYNSTLYKTIPVVAAWDSVNAVASKNDFTFRVIRDNPRNEKNMPQGDEHEILAQLEATGESFFKADKENNRLVYAAPIKLTQDCLQCHGDPANSPNGNGKDILGYPMEGWKAGDIRGAFVLTGNYDKINQVAQSGITKFLLWLLPIVLVALGVFHLLIHKTVVKPLSIITNAIDAMADGDLRQKEVPHSKDEIGRLSRSYEKTVGKLRTMMNRFIESASLLQNSSDKMNDMSNRLTNSSREVNTQAHTVGAAGEQLSANISSISGSAKHMSTSVGHVVNSIEKISLSMKEAANNCSREAQITDEANKKAQRTQKVIEELGLSAKEIHKVVEIISSIADQTNLLALNATIEAASAGESGKGFAVVANEVKELARQSAQATKSIAEQIARIQATTQTSVEAIDEISIIISEVNSISNTISDSIDKQSHEAQEIANSIISVSELTEDVARNVDEGAIGAKEVSQNILSVTKASSESSNIAESSQQSAKELADLSKQLQSLVADFKIE